MDNNLGLKSTAKAIFFCISICCTSVFSGIWYFPRTFKENSFLFYGNRYAGHEQCGNSEAV